jgi:hypothetical protein
MHSNSIKTERQKSQVYFVDINEKEGDVGVKQLDGLAPKRLRVVPKREGNRVERR